MLVSGGENLHLLFLLGSVGVSAILIAILIVVVIRRKRRDRKTGGPKSLPASRVAVFFACFGTWVGSSTLLCLVLVALGIIEHCIWLIRLWVMLGWVVVFPVFWPIYAKRLRKVRPF